MERTRHTLRAHLAVARMQVRLSFHYRTRAFSQGIGALLLIGLQGALWTAVYAGTGEDTPADWLTLRQTMVYAAAGTIWVLCLPNLGLARQLEDKIRDGRITNELLLPMGFFSQWFAAALGRSMGISALVGLPAALVGCALLLPVDLGVGYALRLALTSGIAFVVLFNLSYMIGLSAFFIRRVEGLNEVREALLLLLGGSMMPISLYPAPLRDAVVWTPFAHGFYTPLGTLVKDPFVDARVITIGLVWATLLTVASALYTWRGLRKLVIAGG
ncbi:ABC transporter permease [Streptomyces lancefieldiae]|uniref:ABC-2 family transporter protein n=1 Tax=Streptomyces lancefieldiae TaxID=3075520 RepID=A0ABU3AKZ2_9ACTN|nr:ABC-2 family transporter protein [Streptomyces sp. DSM 40712]MDT0610232.1 ABC-2 family transporter protein [Streptomyces sp. DSM 40712]